MRYAAYFVLALLTGYMFGTPAQANDQIKVVESKYSVKQTLDRLSAILTKKGIRVMARVNHAAGAKAAGLKLTPMELLIFGNPKLGTPLMQTNGMIGLDLPMKVLAWKDAEGKVKMAYTTPDALKSRHGIAGRDAIFGKMTKALAGLTAAAGGKK
jgi:uncharacterized protein (DUF302 family)